MLNEYFKIDQIDKGQNFKAKEIRRKFKDCAKNPKIIFESYLEFNRFEPDHQFLKEQLVIYKMKGNEDN